MSFGNGFWLDTCLEVVDGLLYFGGKVSAVATLSKEIQHVSGHHVSLHDVFVQCPDDVFQALFW